MSLDESRRIDRQAELLGQHADALLRDILGEEHAFPRLDAEHDVLGHGHDRDQHEVLVHHPDARLDRVPRGAEDDGLAVQQDLACIGLVEPVQDVHQRRLARAVLAEQRVHLAATDVEADVVVGEDPGELLADPPHLEHELLGHCCALLMVGIGEGRHVACPPRIAASVTPTWRVPTEPSASRRRSSPGSCSSG